MPINRELIRANGWRQGSAFSPTDSANEWPNGDLPEGSRLILASHDCDILHTANREPLIEVCAAQPIAQVDGNYRFTKNPRVLHVLLRNDGVASPHTLLAHLRAFLPRQRLEELLPDPAIQLEDAELAAITRWLAKRYERAAFPDAFVERLGSVGDEMRNLLRTPGKFISGVFVRLDTEDELGPDEPYLVSIFAVMRKEDYDNEQQRVECVAAIEAIAAEMAACPGIDVIDHDVYSEEKMTLHDLRFVIEFNCDDLSVNVDIGGPMLP